MFPTPGGLGAMVVMVPLAVVPASPCSVTPDPNALSAPPDALLPPRVWTLHPTGAVGSSVSPDFPPEPVPVWTLTPPRLAGGEELGPDCDLTAAALATSSSLAVWGTTLPPPPAQLAPDPPLPAATLLPPPSARGLLAPSTILRPPSSPFSRVESSRTGGHSPAAIVLFIPADPAAAALL